MATKLAGGRKISAQGKTYVGDLVVDDVGVGVEATRTAGLIAARRLKKPVRFYYARWADVTGWDVQPAAQRQLGGSTVNANSVVVSLRTSERVWSTTLHSTSVSNVTNQLGAHLAAVPRI